ncbi:MAG: DUF5694 domain-containing protein, partial [Cyanobacteria bacterium P01_F01_bin.53]
MAALTLVSCFEITQAQNLSETEADVEVMVVGTFHFRGGGGLISVELADTLSEKRQREFDDLVAVLAGFKPNAIILERVTDAPDFIDPFYADFNNQMLLTNRNERVQVGYRLADFLGISRVYGIDEQTSDGEPEYFPFDPILSLANEQNTIGEIQSTIADASRLL